MPKISEFFGVKVYMYYDDHAPPHFHAIYQEAEAVIRISDLAIAIGALPPRALGMVLEWASQHRQELAANWLRLESGLGPVSIEPLK